MWWTVAGSEPEKPDPLAIDHSRLIGEMPEWKFRWLIKNVVASTLIDILRSTSDDMSNEATFPYTPPGGQRYLRGVADSIERMLAHEKKMRTL